MKKEIERIFAKLNFVKRDDTFPLRSEVVKRDVFEYTHRLNDNYFKTTFQNEIH